MRLSKLLMMGGLLLGALGVAVTVYASVRYYISVPFEDQWQTIAELAGNHGVYTWDLLWSQHNEHRQPFSRLFVMADLYWFKGQNLSLYVEIYLLQLVHLYVLVWGLKRFTEWPKWMTGMASGLACFALFCTLQWESFLNPVQGCYMAVFLFATVSLLALVLASEQPQRMGLWMGLWMAVAIVAAFIAEGNLANGLLAWPLLLVAGIRLRLKLLPLAAAAAICIGVYLFGYHRVASHTDPMESLGKPLLVMRYLLVYFGSAWARISLPMGELFAAVGIVAAVWYYGRELLRPVPKRFALFILSSCMFMLGTGSLTALGRLSQSSSTIPSRYETASLLFWLCLGLYALDSATRHQTRTATVVMILAIGMAASLPSGVQGAKDKADQVNAAALPVFADVNDKSAMKALFPDPRLIFMDRQFLLQRQTAFYADERYGLLGKSLASVFSIAQSNRCDGAAARARLVADPKFPGWELTGQAEDRKNARPIKRFVAVTSAGVIAGIGMAVSPGTRWRAYIQRAQEVPVKIYGIVDDGKTACLAASIVAIDKKISARR